MHNGNVGGFDRVRRKLMDRLNDVCFEFAVANGASDTVVGTYTHTHTSIHQFSCLLSLTTLSHTH